MGVVYRAHDEQLDRDVAIKLLATGSFRNPTRCVRLAGVRWVNYNRQHAWIPWIRVIPGWGLERLHDDPRFPEQLRRMNLPPLKPPQ